MGRKRKHEDKYSRILTGALPGRVVGSGYEGVIHRVEPERDERGHLYVWVKWVKCDASCPDCHGEPKRVRWDKLNRNEVKSCGRLKRKLRSEYLKKRKQHPLINAEGEPVPATARLKRVKG